MANLTKLVADYLNWLDKKEKIQQKLEQLKTAIIHLSQEKKIKKIKAGKKILHLIRQSETRFPQIGESGRKKIEKIVKKSGELKEVLTFDIVQLGNLYDQNKISKKLREKLKPFAKRIRSTKIIVQEKKLS